MVASSLHVMPAGVANASSASEGAGCDKGAFGGSSANKRARESAQSSSERVSHQASRITG